MLGNRELFPKQRSRKYIQTCRLLLTQDGSPLRRLSRVIGGLEIRRPRARWAQRNIEGRPFGVDFDRRSLRSDCRQGSKPAARRSAGTSIRVLDCVLAVASVLLGGSWRSSFLGSARWRFYEFSLVLEVMPFRKERSTSPVVRNFSAKIQGRPFGVSFERFRNSLRKERPRE